MSGEPTDTKQLIELVQTLTQQVQRLTQRMAALEQALPDRVPGPAPLDGGAAASGEISQEVVIAIAAALAAYFGEKPHIRQIRLLRSDSWAQKGRTTIQASHVLSIHRN